MCIKKIDKLFDVIELIRVRLKYICKCFRDIFADGQAVFGSVLVPTRFIECGLEFTRWILIHYIKPYSTSMRTCAYCGISTPVHRNIIILYNIVFTRHRTRGENVSWANTFHRKQRLKLVDELVQDNLKTNMRKGYTENANIKILNIKDHCVYILHSIIVCLWRIFANCNGLRAYYIH